MSDADLLATIKQWQSRMTGLPEEAFDGLSFEQKLELASKWYASHVICEQMAAMVMARIMVEDDISIKELRSYFSSTEAKRKTLGRFNHVAGIGEWASAVSKVWLPLLRIGGYRPPLPASVGRTVLSALDDLGATIGVTATNIADTIYRQGLSPYIARRTIGTIRSFAKINPDAARQMFQGLAAAREQAVDAISAVPEADAVVEAIDEQIVDFSASNGLSGDAI